MGILDRFKRRDAEGPPDIGKEDEFEDMQKQKNKFKKKINDRKIIRKGQKRVEKRELKKKFEQERELKSLNKRDKLYDKEFKNTGRDRHEIIDELYQKVRLNYEKVSTQIESLNSLIKGYGERTSMLSQQIGEIRAMNLSTEKKIGRLKADSEKAIDIVQSVKPENLRIEYQRIDARIRQLGERIESNKQFMEEVIDELRDVRKKIGTFMSSEELMKLNEDIKKDLVEVQQMAVKTRMHADKTEQLFAEVRRSTSEREMLNEKVNNLDVNYGGVQRELEKLKLDIGNIVTQQDFDDFRKDFGRKIAFIESSLDSVESVNEDNDKLSELMERALSITYRNKRDIDELSVAMEKYHNGSGHYKDKIDSILRVLDSLAEQISIIKKKIGITIKPKQLVEEKSPFLHKKIFVNTSDRPALGKDKPNLRYIDLHPDVSEKLSGRIPELHKEAISTFKEIPKRPTEFERLNTEFENIRREKEKRREIQAQKAEEIAEAE